MRTSFEILFVYRSLDNCDKNSQIQIIAVTDENLADANYANGNVLVCSNEDNSMEDVQMPLLTTNTSNATIVRKRGGGNGYEDNIDNDDATKR